MPGTFPKQCERCKETTWLNPTPVVVVLVPISTGLLGIVRATHPVGELAFPGGYVDMGESFRAAGSRELREETSLTIPPEQFDVVREQTSSHALHVIVFVRYRFGRYAESLDDLSEFIPNPEVRERVVLYGNEDLAFGSHTSALRDYFAGTLKL